MRVFLDMDGVLVNFVDGALELHGVRPEDTGLQTTEAYNHIIPHGRQGNGDLAEALSLSRNKFYGPMGEDFWAKLRPTRWAHGLVKFVCQYFGEENVGILTSPILTAGCREGKTRWLREHFPQLERRFFVGTDKAFCASPDHILIDDRDKAIKPFTDAGGFAYLWPTSCNRLWKLKEDPLGAVIERIQARHQPVNDR